MDPVTFEEIQAAIEVGQPDTFATTAGGFNDILGTLKALSTELPQAVHGVVGPGGWQGPGATAFSAVATEIVQFLNDTVTPLTPYPTTMTTAGTALTTAKTEIEQYAIEVANIRAAAQAAGTPADEDAINAGAQAILAKLAAAYQTASGALEPIPTSPADVIAIKNGNDPGGNDPIEGEGEGEGNGNGNGNGSPVTGAAVLTSGGLFSSSSNPFGNTPVFGASTLPVLTSADFGNGLPSFALSIGTSNPSTILTGYTGTLEGPPVLTSSAPFSVTGTGSGGSFSFLSTFGQGLPGSDLESSRRTSYNPMRSVLTSVGRLPGLGSDGYSEPPAAQNVLRSGGNPMMLSGAGARGGMGRDRNAERKTSLVGDEDWTDPDGVDGAIGRPAARRASAGDQA